MRLAQRMGDMLGVLTPGQGQQVVEAGGAAQQQAGVALQPAGGGLAAVVQAQLPGQLARTTAADRHIAFARLLSRHDFHRRLLGGHSPQLFQALLQRAHIEDVAGSLRKGGRQAAVARPVLEPDLMDASRHHRQPQAALPQVLLRQIHPAGDIAALHHRIAQLRHHLVQLNQAQASALPASRRRGQPAAPGGGHALQLDPLHLEARPLMRLSHSGRGDSIERGWGLQHVGPPLQLFPLLLQLLLLMPKNLFVQRGSSGGGNKKAAQNGGLNQGMVHGGLE